MNPQNTNFSAVKSSSRVLVVNDAPERESKGRGIRKANRNHWQDLTYFLVRADRRQIFVCENL